MSGFTVVTTLFDTIDKVLNSAVASNVSTLIAEATPVVAIFLTISLMVRGVYSALNPGGGEPLSELIRQYVTIAIILSFATAGGLYQSDILGLIQTLPDTLATKLQGLNSTPYTGIAGLIDGATTNCIEAIKTQFDGAGISANGLMSLVIGIILLIATIAITGLGAGFVLMAKVLLYVVLSLGPLAIFCLLWKPTAGVFSRWVGNVINYSLVIVILALVFGLLMTLFANMISGFINGDGVFDALSTVLGMCLLTVVAVLVLFQVPQVASSFGAGIHAHIGDAARAAMMSGSTMGRMSNILANGIGGKSGSPGGGSGANPTANSSNSGSGLTGKARGSRGKAA